MPMKRNLKVLDHVAGEGQRDLLLEFVAVFSRLEYAMKRGGCYKRTKKPTAEARAVEAGWEDFAGKLKGSFATIDDPLFVAACKFLTSEPPKRQQIRDDKLSWDDTPRTADESTEWYTIRLVKHVRNNLFHGGKFPDGPIDGSERNRHLIEASITILRRCATLYEPVRTAFEESA